MLAAVVSIQGFAAAAARPASARGGPVECSLSELRFINAKEMNLGAWV
jgi:hypothetical protein